ncbi:SDR family NAD(P)-dependent oxidoreductase [Hyphobacterium marinum]|uniref:SDR family NAD(P)-dependent oxidoreductase n=1 Tax=Hyphobacterium marinum TaxID=3116574 RepID=A0ABU7LZZ8_9PROT|nr:SDR family NAD(P)-dependent oxidoreductase [Hyphobacterium sp. Y6023]MEE2567123.1 SDR family NAD(P)-dependent oxidoreductase [Hyphobacterium sp. Y6023]
MSGLSVFSGRTAVITGAASGIGAALARTLAAAGCHLALGDIDGEGLAALADELPESGVRVITTRLDVADREAIQEFAGLVDRAHGGANLLFNNAGVALGGDFHQVPAEDFDWLLAINLGGVVNTTRAFLPQLRRAGTAHIVNISSLFGLIAPAGQTAYCTSKYAVRGFSDSLRHELAGSGIAVTTVHPGGVATKIAERARMPESVSDTDRQAGLERSRRLLRMDPDRAASIILSGVARNKARILVGQDAKTAALLERLFPSHYWSLIARFVDRR